MFGLRWVEKKNGVWPRPELRFCRDSIVLLFYRQCVCDKLPFIYTTSDGAKSLTAIAFLPLFFVKRFKTEGPGAAQRHRVPAFSDLLTTTLETSYLKNLPIQIKIHILSPCLYVGLNSSARLTLRLSRPLSPSLSRPSGLSCRP